MKPPDSPGIFLSQRSVSLIDSLRASNSPPGHLETTARNQISYQSIGQVQGDSGCGSAGIRHGQDAGRDQLHGIVVQDGVGRVG